MSDKKLILCPYCGNTQTEPEDRCGACGGFFDPLSLKVTQQHMGPWFVRDRNNPFKPGCSYEVLVKQIEKGKIKSTTILRGPTTRQFWSVARHVAGVSHLLGYCHHCGAHVEKSAESCTNCGEVFFQPRLRDNLGLAPAGADVDVQHKLSDTGAFEVLKAEAENPSPALTPGKSAGIGATIASFSDSHSRVQRLSDQPVGSSILAGLRSQPETFSNTGGQPAANASPFAGSQFPGMGASEGTGVVSAATAQASASRDAMAWMTGSDQTELDSLATAAADYTPPVRTGMKWMTWVLIAINLLLLVAGGAFVYYAIRGNSPPSGTGSLDNPSAITTTAHHAGTDDSDMAVNLPQRHERPATSDDTQTGTNTRPLVKLPDVPESPGGNTQGTNPLPTGGSHNTEIADPTAGTGTSIFQDDSDRPLSPEDKERRNWAARFKEARDAENRGDAQSALRIYTEIKSKAPADMQPRNLDRAIDRVAELIRRRNAEKVLGR